MTKSDDHEIARLRWRCRSGLREIDELLSRYIENGYAQSGEAERRAFQDLLELSTPDLLDRVLGRSPADSPAEGRLLDVIRRAADD